MAIVFRQAPAFRVDPKLHERSASGLSVTRRFLGVGHRSLPESGSFLRSIKIFVDGGLFHNDVSLSGTDRRGDSLNVKESRTKNKSRKNLRAILPESGNSRSVKCGRGREPPTE